MKIIEYCTLILPTLAIDESVNIYISNWWQPLWWISSIEWYAAQAMVKYEKEEE